MRSYATNTAASASSKSDVILANSENFRTFKAADQGFLPNCSSPASDYSIGKSDSRSRTGQPNHLKFCRVQDRTSRLLRCISVMVSSRRKKCWVSPGNRTCTSSHFSLCMQQTQASMVERINQATNILVLPYVVIIVSTNAKLCGIVLSAANYASAKAAIAREELLQVGNIPKCQTQWDSFSHEMGSLAEQIRNLKHLPGAAETIKKSGPILEARNH